MLHRKAALFRISAGRRTPRYKPAPSSRASLTPNKGSDRRSPLIRCWLAIEAMFVCYCDVGTMQYFCNSDPRRARSHFTKCGICRTSCSTALRHQRDRPPSQTIHRELSFYFSSGDTMTAAARNAELVRRIERSKSCSTAPLQCPRMRQTRADCHHRYRTSRARPARSLNFVSRARVSPACPTTTAERP